jgi:hypothetical protein
VPLRFVFSLVLAVLALSAASATAAPRSASGVSPGLVHRGQNMTLTVATLAKSCTATLRYAGGKVQHLPARAPRKGIVTYVVRIASTAALGPGTWTFNCAGALRSGSFVVAAATSTTVTAAPRVVVDRQGFSQRPDRFGPGSGLSYGLLLHNTSASEDAKNVYVIVNMVASNGELIGSASRTIELVQAGGTFAFGDSISLRTQVSATHLEITIRVGAHEPKKTHPMPDLANVRILPSDGDPGWVSEIDGEIVNVVPKLTLRSANLSIVLLDASGNPVGGGTGFTAATLPSGSRFVFIAQNGFTSVPLAQAVTAVISMEPQWTSAL